MENIFSTALLSWYKLNKRELPWRETKDPYRIWVSEIILQQTRVAQGFDYYHRFLEAFPTVERLAEASEDEVMKVWQGLGYYSRARHMHEAAKSIVERGSFPVTYKDVKALSGVGPYTAAAICSFAYDEPRAVVDGNVYRVLARWAGIDTPIDSTEGTKLFAELAQELMDERHPALYNQAIMDFGATQCTPDSPRCDTCPLMDSCLALAQKAVKELPVKQHKTKVKNRYFNYIYVRAGEFTYLHRRVDDDIWKNLYELPLVETDCVWSEEALFDHELVKQWRKRKKQVTFRKVGETLKHQLTHRLIITNFYELILPEPIDPPKGYLRTSECDLKHYPISQLTNIFLRKQNLL
jgi:A/G-specific adenine glycosylase